MNFHLLIRGEIFVGLKSNTDQADQRRSDEENLEKLYPRKSAQSVPSAFFSTRPEVVFGCFGRGAVGSLTLIRTLPRNVSTIFLA
jgi:hypothetical protein